MRDCPYGICCPWVRGGWALDALGKFFRRRRRRRRRRLRAGGLQMGFRQFRCFFHTFADCSILRVCHEWGPYKRWGAARHAIRSGISIRV